MKNSNVKTKQELKKEVNKNVGKVLAQLRFDKKLTLNQLATILSDELFTSYSNCDFALDYRTLYTYEKDSEIPFYVLVAYARYFGVSTDYILGIEAPGKENIKNKALQILADSMEMIKKL